MSLSYIDSRLAEGATPRNPIEVGYTYWASVCTRPRRVTVLELTPIGDGLVEATVTSPTFGNGKPFGLRTCYFSHEANLPE